MYITIKFKALQVFKVDGAGPRVGNWQKPMIFIDFEVNYHRKWPRDPLSVATWTWKLLKWLLVIFNLPMKPISIEQIANTVSVWSIHVTILSNSSLFYIENDEKQFFEPDFFSSIMKMNGSKQHPIFPFTLSTRFKDLVLTLLYYRTTLVIDLWWFTFKGYL